MLDVPPRFSRRPAIVMKKTSALARAAVTVIGGVIGLGLHLETISEGAASPMEDSFHRLRRAGDIAQNQVDVFFLQPDFFLGQAGIRLGVKFFHLEKGLVRIDVNEVSLGATGIDFGGVQSELIAGVQVEKFQRNFGLYMHPVL